MNLLNKSYGVLEIQMSHEEVIWKVGFKENLAWNDCFIDMHILIWREKFVSHEMILWCFKKGQLCWNHTKCILSNLKGGSKLIDTYRLDGQKWLF